jgi:hypothetical protein
MIKVDTIPEFDKSLVMLSKKYRSLKAEYLEFIEKIEKDGVQGDPLGKGIFKARLGVKSKGKGKSVGLHAISYNDVIISIDGDNVLLIEIYDKSEFSTVNKKLIEKKIQDYISKL